MSCFKRAGETVELPDHERVLRSQVGEGGEKFRPLPLGAGGLLDKDLVAAGRLQGIELQVGVLVLGGHAGVTDEHLLLAKVIQTLAFWRDGFKRKFREMKSGVLGHF